MIIFGKIVLCVLISAILGAVVGAVFFALDAWIGNTSTGLGPSRGLVGMALVVGAFAGAAVGGILGLIVGIILAFTRWSKSS